MAYRARPRLIALSQSIRWDEGLWPFVFVVAVLVASKLVANQREAAVIEVSLGSLPGVHATIGCPRGPRSRMAW